MHQLSLCLPLGVQHDDCKSKNTHQGSKWDADKVGLETLKSLVLEYNLTVSVTLVMLYCNLAYQLTHELYIAMVDKSVLSQWAQ